MIHEKLQAGNRLVQEIEALQKFVDAQARRYPEEKKKCITYTKDAHDDGFLQYDMFPVLDDQITRMIEARLAHCKTAFEAL